MRSVQLDIAELATLSFDKPVIMLNLLRYQNQASFPEGSDDLPCTGQEAYIRYAQTTTPMVLDAGAAIRFAGQSLANVVAPEKEQWDDVILVEYPSVKVFLGIIQSDAYQEVSYLRTAALYDSRLIALQEGWSLKELNVE
jgi:uncharacterized protein (DUF1330 family)